MPLDGKWSNESTQPGPIVFDFVSSKDRPHMYYFMMLDCAGNLITRYGKKPPQISTKWTIMRKESNDYTDEYWTHFSFEDAG